MALLDNIGNDLRRQFSPSGKMINQIIVVNVALFFALGVIHVILKLGGLDTENLMRDVLSVPSDLSKLLVRPWTLLSYGITHYPFDSSGFWHILFNMLWLFWFGRILEEYLGKRKILPIFIWGVLAGAVFYLLAYNLLPMFSETKNIAQLNGASAGVMAIAWATVALLPEHRLHLLFIGPVKILYIALFMTLLHIIGLTGTNAGGNFAHLGGALMGFLFIHLYQKGTDLSVGVNNFLDWSAELFSRKKKMKVVYSQKRKPKRKKEKARVRTQPKSKRSKSGKLENSEAEQAKIDAILDKISQSGYESLSEEEKAFLFNMSKKK